MRALTLWPEWAWAVAHAGKYIENRVWPAPAWVIGERIAIHAGARRPDLPSVLDACASAHLPVRLRRGELHIDGRPIPVVRSAIVAVATVHACELDGWTGRTAWALHGAWHWVFTEVVALRDPIPCSGALGLWNVPEGLAERV